MVEMKLNLPKPLNILLRRFVMETDKKNKNIAIIYILKNFLNEFYKGEKKWKEKLIKRKVINALIVKGGLD